MTATTQPPQPPVAGEDPLAQIEAISSSLRGLTDIDWIGLAGDAANQALVALEDVSRSFTALQTDLIAAVEASGLWALDGHRTFVSWLSSTTGITRASSSRATRLSRTLRDHLPATRRALAEGTITRDHAELIARDCTATDLLRSHLADTGCGEDFLIESARLLEANQFSKVTKKWAMMADPEAADRGWREASSKEEVLLSATTDGYLLSGWLSLTNGAALATALDSHMGRKAADDLRSPRQRRAEALVNLAKYSLQSGERLKHARIRPHLTVTVSYETLMSLSAATTTRFDAPPLFPSWVVDEGVGPEATRASIEHLLSSDGDWIRGWTPGSDHVIATGFDYTCLENTEPGSLSDETALPPHVLSKLACESMISRVVFGPDSTVLDSGREERIFPAHQVRAIIARDRHCQYPGCDSPPEYGEIHHSAEWFKHNGTTHVDLGILLCWHHHGLVHERSITIFRISGQWLFMDRTGRPITPPDHTHLFPPDPEPPPW